MAAERVQRERDRGVADHVHARARDPRLEEDLQRAAADAGVVDGDRAVDRGALAVAGLDTQQEGLARLHHAQGVQAHTRLGAVAADEALDRAVRGDQRGGTGAHAGGAAGAHDRGVDVGDALSLELRRALV
jgi:hypothetical protein